MDDSIGSDRFDFALRNWHSFHKLGASHINTPGMYHSEVSLAEAVSLGDLRHPQSPDEPIVVHMERTPCAPGHPIKDQHRLGRAELLATSIWLSGLRAKAIRCPTAATA